MLDLLIEHNADITVRDTKKRSLLHLAACQKNSPICEKLLSLALAVDAVDEDGATPLHEAVQVNNLELVKLLLDKNADINKPDNDGYTPLHVAARSNRLLLILEYLLKNKAASDAKTVHGDLPLHIAAGCGKCYLIQLLFLTQPVA